jgi:hypothetical protein
MKLMNRIDLPDVDITAEKVHQAWIDSKLKQGITSRISEWGEEFMQPYWQLSEKAKDMDKATVIAVYEAIKAAGFDARW